MTGQHRPPSRLTARTVDIAIAGTLSLALLSATCGIANAYAPHATAPHTAAAPTAIELPREPTGHGGPIAAPTFADPHVWAPTDGPVIANGQRLPAVTATVSLSTSFPKPAATPPTQAAATTPKPTPTPAPTQPATGLLALVNADRATAGCPPVTIAADLTSQAQTQSNAQAAADFMSHSAGPSGYDSWGENVAAGQETEAEVHQAWLDSPPHRANIESCEFTVIGYASAVSASGKRYWTQEFGA